LFFRLLTNGMRFALSSGSALCASYLIQEQS
jgi:hypothetical protein